MKSIIIYFSLTGNTKQIAQAIHKGISLLRLLYFTRPVEEGSSLSY